MLKAKSLYLFIVIPLGILLFLSGYLGKTMWDKYQYTSTLKTISENIQLLQEYESAILDESLCKILVLKNSEKISQICQNRIKKTAELSKEFDEKNSNLSIWKDQISLMKTNLKNKNISNFESLLGGKALVSTAKLYLDTLDFKISFLEEKELLKLYSDISNSIYTTKLENFLVTYYVSNNISVSTSNMIFWDKIVETSYIPEIKNEKLAPSIQEKFNHILNSNSVHAILSNIDDMRITILTGNMIQSSKNIDWIALLEKKQKVLNNLKFIIQEKLDSNFTKHMSSSLLMIFIYLAIILLSLFGLIYFYTKNKKDSKDDKALLTVVNRINTLASYDINESEEMKKMLDTVKNKEDLFNYINSSFQLLHEKKKQSEDEATSKSEFLSTLSHEIRTPLNGIIGFSKLLRDMGATQDQEEFLTLIEGSSHNLIAIVNDILDLSKINADKMVIENVSFNIIETIESTVARFIQQTDQKDIELGVFIDPFLANYFLGDATKLSQILTNLIGNAVKFTNAYGKINVFVQSMHDDENETQIKFAVHDDGIGLSEEQRKNIFNAFSQATKNTSTQYGGTGLGLTISQQMVSLMGGTLKVTSKPNRGSSFYFTLPLKKDKAIEAKKYPDFSDVSVGIALPVKNLKRQLDTNLETYMRYLGAKFSIHYYEDLFEGMGFIDLPDIMIFDHHYARLEGELEQCLSLDCKSVLLTNGTLRSRIDPQRHHFNDILLRPIGLHKCIRILRNTREKNIIESKSSTELTNIESFEGLSALVVDDNMINRKLIKIILEKIGLSVTLSSDGKEAFEKYQGDSFDIIFMDIQMPVMDGVEATHKILEYEKGNRLSHVPIIALTANVSTGDREYFISEGMDDYATKPLDVETLKRLIAEYCHINLSSKNKVK